MSYTEQAIVNIDIVTWLFMGIYSFNLTVTSNSTPESRAVSYMKLAFLIYLWNDWFIYWYSLEFPRKFQLSTRQHLCSLESIDISFSTLNNVLVNRKEFTQGQSKMVLIESLPILLLFAFSKTICTAIKCTFEKVYKIEQDKFICFELKNSKSFFSEKPQLSTKGKGGISRVVN